MPSKYQTCTQCQLNLQKLMLYISITDNDLPTIDLTQSQTVAIQLRMYFNDDQLHISLKDSFQENYLASPQFQTNILQVVQEFGYEVDEKDEDWGFLQFLQFWVMEQKEMVVKYEIFEEIYKEGVGKYLENVLRSVARTVFNTETNNNNDTKLFSDSKNKPKTTNNKPNTSRQTTSPTSKTSICQTNIIDTFQQQPTDRFSFYLNKFYHHYCKQTPNTLKPNSFHKLQHFYTTLNLTKFLLYCKQIGLLKAHKSITVKYIQQLFVKNMDQRQVVEYQGFTKMVREILTKVFPQEGKIETEGYKLIGVESRANFVEKMGRIGVTVPLRKVLFAKPKKCKIQKLVNVYAEELKREQQISVQILKEQKQNSAFVQAQNKNGGYSYAYQSAWLKIQSPPVNIQSTHVNNISFLPLLPSSHSNNKLTSHLQQLLQLDSQDDPYLRRFKRGNFEKSQQIDAKGSGSGVIDRMEKRIEGVVRRVR